MKKQLSCSLLLGVVLCFLVGSVSFFTSCDSTDDTTNGKGDSAGNSDTSTGGDGTATGGASTKCSEDGSESLVPGTYIYELSSAASGSKPKTQVKILRSDCKYCFETVREGDSTALTSDGSWTSKLGTKDSNGQQIDITAGGVVYTLSGSGQTLTQSSSSWYKTKSGSYTCDGESVL